MDKVKIGIVGIGGRGVGFAKMANELSASELAGVAEPNPLRAERAKKRLGVDFPTYSSVEEMLEKGDVDAVIIATPDYMHKDNALACFAAGKHVLLEKPIATSVDDAMTILEASRKNDRVLYMGFNLRHSAVIVQMKHLISEQNAIGKPFYLTALEYYDGGRTYMARWNRLKKYSGGLFVHKGTHDFDVLNWLNLPAHPKWVSASAAVNILNPDNLPFEVGPDEEVGPSCEVCQCAYKCPDKAGFASGDNPLFDTETAEHDNYSKDLCIYLSDKDTHDNAMAIVEYDNGSRAFHSEVFITPITNRQYTIIGDKGHMEADLHKRSIDIMPRWTKNKISHHVENPPGGHGGSDPGLVGSFLGSILRGERPVAGAIDGIWSVAVSCAAELSREEGRVVQISELLDVNSELLKDEE